MKIPIPFLPRMVVVRIEADPRRSSRLRFSIGGLMILIALLAVVFGVEARRRKAERQVMLDSQNLARALAAFKADYAPRRIPKSPP